MPLGELNKVNLNSVTAATVGETVDTRFVEKKTVYVEVSGNTGAVTVTIQHSPDKTKWYDLVAKTYTASNEDDDWTYTTQLSYMRTKTSTHANATVKTTIIGRNSSSQ
jgi:hypothetical protein